MKPLVIIGVGGHGREAYDIITAMNDEASEWDLLGFLDDARQPGSRADPLDLPVLGGTDWLSSHSAWAVVGVGDPRARKQIVSRLGPSARYASLRNR